MRRYRINKILQDSTLILNLRASVLDMVDVTKFVGDALFNNESFVLCVI